jgi:hypothetical protein
MQITDEVTAEGKAKMLILNWPKPRQPKRFRAFYEYRWKKRNFQIDEAYF